MSNERQRELSGRVRSWLREDGHENADRVLDTVLDQLNTTPQRHANWLARRFPIMNSNGLRFGIAAAAVVIVAILGFRFFGPANSTGGPQATPTPTPVSGLAQNGKIIVTDGNVLRAFDPDGSGMTVLDTLPGPILSVVVSPDGTRVAYPYENGDHQGLRVMNLSSGETTDLPVPDAVGGEPVGWSPDGESITFGGLDGEVEHVYIAAVDGSSLRAVAADTIDNGLQILSPVWSPDGQWLAFVGKPPTGQQGRMYLVRPDGSELHQLDTARVEVGDGGFISWAPDPSVQRLLYLVAASGGGLQVRLHDVATSEDYDTGLTFWPSWSPDGKQISGCCTSIVNTTDVFAGNPKQVTVFAQPQGNCPDLADFTGRAICSGATWSPDGTTLIGSDIVDSKLLMAPADGSGTPVQIDLTTATGLDAHVAWQPIRP
jgi:WD40 repeat protein